MLEGRDSKQKGHLDSDTVVTLKHGWTVHAVNIG